MDAIAIFRQHVADFDPDLAARIGEEFGDGSGSGISPYAPAWTAVHVAVALLGAVGGPDYTDDVARARGAETIVELAANVHALTLALGGHQLPVTALARGICRPMIAWQSHPDSLPARELQLVQTLVRLAEQACQSAGVDPAGWLERYVRASARSLAALTREQEQYATDLQRALALARREYAVRMDTTRESEGCRRLDPEDGRDFDAQDVTALAQLASLREAMFAGAWAGIRTNAGEPVTREYVITETDLRDIDDPLDLAHAGLTNGELYDAYLSAAAAGSAEYGRDLDEDVVMEDEVTRWLDGHGCDDVAVWRTILVRGLPHDFPQMIFYPQGRPDLALWGRYGH